MNFVSDLRQVGGFLRVHQFPPPIKLTATVYLKILLKVALKDNQTNKQITVFKMVSSFKNKRDVTLIFHEKQNVLLKFNI